MRQAAITYLNIEESILTLYRDSWIIGYREGYDKEKGWNWSSLGEPGSTFDGYILSVRKDKDMLKLPAQYEVLFGD